MCTFQECRFVFCERSTSKIVLDSPERARRLFDLSFRILYFILASLPVAACPFHTKKSKRKNAETIDNSHFSNLGRYGRIYNY